MASHIGFQVPGNNSLVKANVKFKDVNNGLAEIDYGTLELIGANGNYVAKTFVAGWYEVALYINGTLQESFGTVWVGSPPYLNSGGGTMAGDLNMDSHKITNLPAPIDNAEPARLAELAGYLPLTGGTLSGHLTVSGKNVYASNDYTNNNSLANWGTLKLFFLQLAGGTMAGIIDMGAFKISNIGTPTAASNDAARISDVEGLQDYIENLLTDKVSKSASSTVNALVTFASGNCPKSVSNAVTSQELANLGTVTNLIDAKIPLLVYRAKLNATSGEPTATVFTNTTGGTVSFAHAATGKYSIGSSNAAFAKHSGISYVLVNISNGSATTKRIYTVEHSTTSWMYIYCFDDTGTAQDGMEDVSIELLIFPVPGP